MEHTTYSAFCAQCDRELVYRWDTDDHTNVTVACRVHGDLMRLGIGPAKGADDLRVLLAQRDRYGEALEEIRDQDWTENALDPQWAARIAKEALNG